MAENKYRERIYRGYVSARSERLAPLTIAGLRPRAGYLNQLIQRHFPVDLQAEILELGCGHGALMYFAQRKGYTRIKGIDGSAEQVAVAEQLGIANVQQGDVLKTLADLDNDSLDAIIAFDVLEHFNRDELIGLVDEIYRVVKPNGRVIIHVPNGDSPFFGHVFYSDLTHETVFTRASLSQLFLSSGFDRVDCFEDRPILKSVKGIGRWLIWVSFRQVLRLYLAAETGDIRDGIFSQNMLAVVWK